MYSFIGFTWNPIKGSCIHECNYCFASSIRHRFRQDSTLRLTEKDLRTPLGQGRQIFVGSSIDMFAPNIPAEWLQRTFDHIAEYPENEYLLQSKNPERFHEFLWHPIFAEGAKNILFCTTIESDIDYPEVSKAPAISERIDAMKRLSSMGYKTMVTVEPILAFTSPENFSRLLASLSEVVNIGANSSQSVKLPEPSKEDVLELIQQLEKLGITVNIKSTLNRIIQ